MPDMQSVGSSAISSAGWEPPDQLYIEFPGGETYRFSGISESVFNSFVNSSSPGGFFQRSIRPYGRGERL